MPRSIFALIGAVCLCNTGCGTFSDAMCGPIDNNIYYRGVRLDIAAVKEGGPKTLLAADIPLSAVADTLLIPYYARVHREREANLRIRSETAPNLSAKTDTLKSNQTAEADAADQKLRGKK